MAEKEIKDVGFAYQMAEGEATDQEINDMIDDVIYQTLGPNGLGEIIKPGQKVVIKVNLVGPYMGARGEKGRSIITDARVVRCVAEKVREIIGFGDGAELTVADCTMYRDRNPSLKSAKSSFYWGKFELTGDNSVDPWDICYDGDGDGILDGTSRARLVNLDSMFEDERVLHKIKLHNGHTEDVAFPKFLRTKEEAGGAGDYCDVLIGLPVLKSHGILGMSGAVKLHYGFRSQYGVYTDTGRHGHSGTFYDEKGFHHKQPLMDYTCATHLIRPYDFSIMDCLTANRRGPQVPTSGIVRVPDVDSKADFIVTNAMLASKDSVALDVVATALAGYKLESIGLLKEAAQNGIGEYEAEYIRVGGHMNFSRFRQYLSDKFGPSGKYPLQDGWGGARVLESTETQFTLSTSTPEKIGEGRYALRYQVSGEIARVDMFVSDRFVDSSFEQGKGQLVLDLEKFPMFKGTSLICYAVAWDKIFNCITSIERFIYPN
jgi:uncharacterized protein (DUF362 family)